MTSEQFDAWLSSITTGAYRIEHNDERNDRAELDLLRETQSLRREQHRLQVLLDLHDTGGDSSTDSLGATTSARLADIAKQLDSISAHLREAGWTFE